MAEITKTSTAFAAEKKRASIKAKLKSIGIYSGLSIWALAVLFPFFWMVLNSFKTFGSYNAESVPCLMMNDGTLSAL